MHLMKRIRILSLLAAMSIMAVSLIAHKASAAVFIGTSATGVDVPCYVQNVGDVAAQNLAGSIAVCMYYDGVAHSNTTTTITAVLSTPQLLGAGASTSLTLLTEVSTCLISDETSLVTGNTAAGTMRSSRFNITMLQDDCRGYLRATVTAGDTAAVVSDLFLPLVIVSKDSVVRADSKVRYCSADEFGTECQSSWSLLLPLLVFLLLAIWAEVTRGRLEYILAVLTGIYAVVALPASLEILRIVIVGAMFLLLRQAILGTKDKNEELET